MPLIDKPLEELKQYRGISSRPADIDDYWNRALEEMRSVSPDVELVDHSFTSSFARCYDLFFTGVNNARIHVRYVKPNAIIGKAPAVLRFHGYSGSAGDWTDGLAFAAEGFHVFSMDCRGQGGSSEDTGGVKGNTLNGHIIRGLDDEPEKLLYRSIFLDTAELAALVMAMDDVDETKVAAAGGSQGGALALVCASLVPEINRCAPAYPFLSDYRRVWEMDLAENAYRELQDYFRHFDPTHERENDIFTRLGYIDIKNLTGRIRGKVLMATGLMDTVCPPSTQFAAYNGIGSEKSMVIYPDFGHELLPGWSDRVFSFFREMR